MAFILESTLLFYSFLLHKYSMKQKEKEGLSHGLGKIPKAKSSRASAYRYKPSNAVDTQHKYTSSD